MEVTAAIALDLVGRLMQLVCASQIWALYISGCGHYNEKKYCIQGSQPSDEAANPWMTRSYKSKGGSSVLQTWFAAAASLTPPNLPVISDFCCRADTDVV